MPLETVCGDVTCDGESHSDEALQSSLWMRSVPNLGKGPKRVNFRMA
jgi:hypothetical protein